MKTERKWIMGVRLKFLPGVSTSTGRGDELFSLPGRWVCEEQVKGHWRVASTHALLIDAVLAQSKRARA